MWPRSACTRIASGREDRKRFPPADRRRRRELGGGHVDRPLGKPRENLLERHPALQAGQRGAEAEVDAPAERQVLLDLAMDVEPVTVRVPTIVAARGSEQEEHGVALGHRLTVDL